MVQFGYDKFIDFLFKRGLGFLAMGGYVVYNIATRDVLFGRNIADNDKGLIIILAILALIMAHYFVAFWMSKREYYSPSSLRDATYDDVIKARSLLTKHSPQRLSNKDQWAASINDLSPLVDKIPLGFGRDEFIKVMGLYLSLIHI